MKNWKTNKIVGIVTLCINILFLVNPICMEYCYRFPRLLFMFLIPFEHLLINALLGIVGISMSIMLYKGVVALKWFLILILVLWIVMGVLLPPFVGISTFLNSYL